MKRIIAIAALLLFGPHASSGSTLLMEIRNESGRHSTSLEMDFAAGTLFGYMPGFGVFEHPWITFGTITATPDELAMMVPELMNGDKSMRLYLNGVTRVFRVDDLWTNGTIYPWFMPEHNGSAEVSSYVPKLGSGLTGYRITSITQLATPLSSSEVLQTVRIFGEVVPEPVTWVFVAIALTAYAVTRTR